MKKVLFYVIYPAPYRIELIDLISKQFDSTVFCETSEGDKRNNKFFSNGNYYCLDTKFGKKKFSESRKSIKSFDLVFIYDFSTKNSFSLMIKCIKHKIPYIINSDGVLLFRHGNLLKKIVKKFFIKRASALVASGKKAKDYFIDHGANKENIFIHNFSSLHSNQILKQVVSSEQKQLLRAKYNLPKDKTIVLCVGRFIALKQYDQLLNKWNKMPSNILLLLVGGGELEADYKVTIQKNKIKNAIIRGFYSTKNLQEIYQACDIFVHPTSYDCWGLVINEAMANSLPVVSSDMCVAGLELISDSINGYIVEYNNFDKYLDRIMYLSNNKNICESMSTKNLVKIKNYTIEHMADVHIAVITKIFAKAKIN